MSTHFLQSAQWAAFQTQVGHRAILVDKVYAYEHCIGPFRYLYVPRASYVDESVLNTFAQNYQWIRVEGPVETTRPMVATRARQPQTTLMVDLSPDTAEILAQMHKKTRYNIRLAARKGVTIQHGADIDTFWELTMATTERDGFAGHNKRYYEAFLHMDMATQFTAYLDETPIASIITVLHEDTMTYVHGASANKHRNVMAPYRLQWEAMQYGKAQGAIHYDMWGIAPIYPQGEAPHETCYNDYCWDATHPWTGITRFKVGFGGDIVQYPDARDVVCSPMAYHVYRFIHHMRYGRKK